MERHEILELMSELKLAGMRTAFDELVADGLKRQHPVQRIIGELLKAEIAEKQARSIKYQLTIARLPLAKELAEFEFAGTPINEGLVRDLAAGDFLTHQRNTVLVGGTGTGKSHLAIAIARSCIRAGARGRFYNVVDLVTTASRPRPAMLVQDGLPTTSPGSISSSSMSSATCRSPSPVASCCST